MSDEDRLIYRNPRTFGPGANYQRITLRDLRWVPAHTDEVHEFDGKQFSPKKVARKDAVRVAVKNAGALRDVEPTQLDTYVRRPLPRHLARIAAAEEALRQAAKELELATMAAWKYGKPLSIAAVKTATRERSK